MKRKYLIFIYVTVLFLVGFIQASTEGAQDQNDLVQARIGIQISSDQMTERAKTRQSVKPKDQLQINVIPEFDPAYIYVIYDNEESVKQLYQGEYKQVADNETVKLPSAKGVYTIDGEHSREHITIICSPKPLPEIEKFLKAKKPSSKKWQKLEQKLLDRSKLALGDEPPQDVNIAGKIRDPLSPPDADEPEPPMFSGKGFVVKKYEFQVKE